MDSFSNDNVYLPNINNKEKKSNGTDNKNTTSVKYKRFKYGDKISAIRDYFNVSDAAAKYMYHRRRRGYPYKLKDDQNFVEWNVKIQNALIKADNLSGWDWRVVNFDEDVELLKSYDIIVADQSNNIYKNNRQSQNNDIVMETENEWTVVSSSKTDLRKKYILKKIGFLPKNRRGK